MAKVEFEISEGLTFVHGVAVVVCLNADGEEILYTTDAGNVPDYTAIGLLSVALDKARSEFDWEGEDGL